MAAAKKQEDRRKKEEENRKREERRLDLSRRSSAEEFWYPNQQESQYLGWNAGDYFAGGRTWDTDEINYTSKRSTLKLEFHHIDCAREATICVRLDVGSSLAPIGFQGVFTASTASIDDVEVMLLDFREGKLPVAGDGTINLSRRVVSVSDDGNEQLKVQDVPRDGRGVTTSQTLIMGVAPSSKASFQDAAAATGAENGGCKCGDNCTCNPCTCK
ncbi:hypothetical protein QYE76_049614 [Lolium multiflorum]|uniref:Metallothionein-like protein n=1 Tax=Lolium multiflorum TaxID=4521 RepID=A0AAD8SPH4_LOLMU|nr:hypothetical protein QYE76_049614 [Lolium multiflorum]